MRCARRLPKVPNNSQVFKINFAHGSPQKQYLNGDPNIAEDLVEVRGKNGCRFIVNCHGVVLTKGEGRNDLEPRYVGKINSQEWFEDGL